MLKSLSVLCIAWLVYFVLHSTLASLAFKNKVASLYPNVMPWYRVMFNSVAILGLLPILWLLRELHGHVLWSWQMPWLWLSYVIAGLSVVGFIHSLKYYDLSEFMGFRQIKEHSHQVVDQAHLTISPYHRFVRHPWYFFAIILIWTRDMDSAWLLSSVLLSAYFLIGSKLEDAKLVAYYGVPYAQYMNKVNGVLILPWRILSKDEALEIQTHGNLHKQH